MAIARCTPSASAIVGRVKRVILRRGVTFRERMFDDFIDDDAVLGMHADQTAAFACCRHAAKDRRIVNQKNAGVGHEHFEARHAFVHRCVQLFDLIVFELGRDQVKPIVDRRLAFGFLVPVVDALDERLAFVLHGEVDDRRGAAVCCGARTGCKVVGSLRAAEGQFHVCVRIDAAGNHEFAGGIDDLVRPPSRASLR